MAQRFTTEWTMNVMVNSGFLGTKLVLDVLLLHKGLAGTLCRAMQSPGEGISQRFRIYRQILWLCTKEIITRLIKYTLNHDRILCLGVAPNGQTSRKITDSLTRPAQPAEHFTRHARWAAWSAKFLQPWRRILQLAIDASPPEFQFKILQCTFTACQLIYALLFARKKSAAKNPAKSRLSIPAHAILLAPVRRIGRLVLSSHNQYVAVAAMSTLPGASSTAANSNTAADVGENGNNVADEQAPVFPPGSKEAIAEKKRKSRNDARNQRRKKRRIAGPLYPYAINVYAGPNKEQFSLESFRASKKTVMGWVMAELFKGLANGVDTANYTIDDMVTSLSLFVIYAVATYVDFQKFVEKPHAPGVKTSDKPARDRYGHGIILTKHEEAAQMAREAFLKATYFTNAKGQKVAPVCEAKKEDTRAVYTVNTFYYEAISHCAMASHQCVYTNTNNKLKYMYWPQVAVDKWAGELCSAATEGTVWHYAVLFYKLPALGGLEITKIIEPTNDSERLVLVLCMNEEWEKKLDTFPRTANGEIPLRLGIGTFNLRKRRAGEKSSTTKKPAGCGGGNPDAAAARIQAATNAMGDDIMDNDASQHAG